MTDPSRCRVFADAILDEAAPPPDGLARHLEDCATCRGLAAAHRGARSLANPRVASPPAVLEQEVLARVRLRRRTRLAGAGFAVGALVAIVLVPAGRPPEADRPGGDLFALAEGVAALTHRDPLEGDPALRGLGAVSDWFAPPRASSLGLDSIVRPPASAAPRGDAP